MNKQAAIVQLVYELNMTREQAEDYILKNSKPKGNKHRQRRSLSDEPTEMPDWKRIELENELLRSMQRRG